MNRPLSITTDPIPQLTWRIAIPASVGMFFNTLFNFTDTYFAGFLGTDALAALAFTFPLFFLLIAMASGLSQGTTALLANALGEGERNGAVAVFAQALVIAITLGVVVPLAGWVISPSLLLHLGARAVPFELSLDYMRVILAGGGCFILTMTLNSALAAQGETRIYRNFLIGGFFANLLLNPLFIWGWFPGVPAMGVAGIALATVLIQVAGCALLWRSVRRNRAFHHIPWTAFRPNLSLIRQILGQSLPAMLNMATIALGIFVMVYYVKHFGDEAVAALGIATRIEQLVLMPVIGLSTAMLSITGQNYGAGFSHRVEEAWKTGLKQGIACMVAGAILIVIFGESAIRIFTRDPAIIVHGRDYLRIAALTLAAYPILFGTVFMMQGLKRPGYGLWIGLYRQIAAPVVVFHLLAFTFGWGLWGIWWGVCLVTWSAAMFTFHWGGRTLARLTPHPASL
jgi:putative MATE family efflux protein